MKRTILFLALITMIACKDNDVSPVEDNYPLIKTVTRYADDSETPANISYFNYDDQDRLIEQRNTDPGWLSASLTTLEYISDRHVKVNYGSNTYDMYFNERGDVIKMNEDIFAYAYEEDKITVTITSDSDTWDVINYLDNGNVIRSVDTGIDFTMTMSYDNMPNYERSLDMGGSLICANNVLTETHLDGYGDPYEVVYTYQYNDEGYVIEKIRAATRGDWESSSRYEIEYYN